ncbi:unnamed protein product [Caenorhabditis sp. 36 PRJEB53466]|nr:unnamed protein product [Caenorhabditis sp. 36 PRJEB53466]
MKFNLELLVLILGVAACQANLLNFPRAAIRLTKEFTGMEKLRAPEELGGADYDMKIDVETQDVLTILELAAPVPEDEHADFEPDMKLESPFEKEDTVPAINYPKMVDEDFVQPRPEIIYPEDFHESVVEILDSRNEREIALEPVAMAKLEKGYFENQETELDDSDSSDTSDSSSSSEEEPEWDEARPYLKCGCLKKSGKVFESKSAPREWESAEFTGNDLPTALDWRNVSGVNYCSPTRNQHIPVYCGSCWVFGTTGALNDRFNVARKGRWPMTQISPQEIIDCNGKGNCQGGEIGNVLEHAKIQGLVEEGCNVYRATNGECNPFRRCGSCWPNECFSLNNYTRYYVKDYGSVKGIDNIKAEIKKGGPLACAIGATKKFEYEYVKGVYFEKSDLESNHIISLTGWGVDENGVEYWIARNSWGEAWGELGWFRVVTSKFKDGQGDQYNMGIERDCYFADVDVSNLN